MIARRRNATARVATTTLSALTALALLSCDDSGITSAAPRPPRSILVLDGFIQPALTSVPDSGVTTSRIALGSTTEFDAGGFSLHNDTVLAVSSRTAGDLLYVVDITSALVRKIQLPARSNPSRAHLFKGTGGQALIGVALRDSGSVALVTVGGAGAPTVARLANAGTCPTDLFQYDNATWVVDANANCRTNYALQGDVRLIRIPNTGITRDTLTIPGMRGSGAGAIVSNDVAYVFAGGDANFASFPYTLISSGSIARIDLKNRRVIAQKGLPAGTYGAGTKLGLDGYHYVTLYENLSTFKNRIVKVRADDLGFVGSAVASWLSLTGAGSVDVPCGSGQADALGRLHCIVNGTGSATSVVVFNTLGTEIRRVSAGQGGVDLWLR